MRYFLNIGENQFIKSYRHEIQDYGWTPVKALDEKDVLKQLENRAIEAIVFEPLLSSDFLIDDTKVIEQNLTIGGTGLVLFNNMKTAMKPLLRNPKIIFLTCIKKENLIKTGFPEDIFFLWKFSVIPYQLIEELDKIEKSP